MVNYFKEFELKNVQNRLLHPKNKISHLKLNGILTAFLKIGDLRWNTEIYLLM